MSDTSFLYPFLEPGDSDPHDLLVSLATSAQSKILESDGLIEQSLGENELVLVTAAREMATRISAGGVVLTIGNGGSACDSIAFATQLRIAESSRSIPARSLASDPATITALTNDIGVEQVFSRQIEAFGGPGDVVVAFSTSGQSSNVLGAIEVANRRGLLTVAFAGYNGGAMTDNAHVDHCIIVRSDSVHRIQESQAHLSARLRTLIINMSHTTREQA